MTPLHTLALLLCAVGVLIATCLVIRAAFRRRRRRPVIASYGGVTRSAYITWQTHVEAVNDARANVGLPPKPYSEFDPLHWSKKPL